MLKQMKRTPEVYKAKNVFFVTSTVEARSYNWWKFVAIIEGKVIFNDYRYSVTTAKHQRQVNALMRELGIKIDIAMPVPKGLQCYASLEEVILASEEYLCEQIGEQEIKRQEKYARAKQRKAEKQALLDAEFKANLDSITYADVIAFRATKGGAR